MLKFTAFIILSLSIYKSHEVYLTPRSLPPELPLTAADCSYYDDNREELEMLSEEITILMDAVFEAYTETDQEQALLALQNQKSLFDSKFSHLIRCLRLEIDKS